MKVRPPVPELRSVLARNGIDIDTARLALLPDIYLARVPAAIARHDDDVARAIGIKIGRFE